MTSGAGVTDLRSECGVPGEGVLPIPAETDHSAGIPCFTPGTMISTANGEQRIESLRVGDRVFTRDHGLQPIRWIGRRRVVAEGGFAPILIRPKVVQGMTRPLLVSPQHRILFSGLRAALLFGESEVFVAAEHLIDGIDVIQHCGGTVTYIHLMFDCHEVIYSNGAPSESFHPGNDSIGGVAPASREALFQVFPQLRSDVNSFGRTARRCLRKVETEQLRSAS